MTMSVHRKPLGISIVASRYPFSGRVPLVPPILEYLAALTLREMPDAQITLLDANQQDLTPEDIRTDIVAISAMTATITWAYRFADACRKRGVRVILGGIHPTALPDEAALHADTVVVGEAESVWGEVLRDLVVGRLKRFYHGERLPLTGLPRPIDGKLKGNYQFRAFFTMRGCPYRCTFCSVRRFFGDTIRYRPIPEVVDEIEACAGNVWFNGDDNIWGGDLRRSTDLFSELAKGTKRKWYGFGDLRSVQGSQGERMLRAARESGLFSVWVGWESEDEHLQAFNASGKQGRDRIAAVKRMQDAGIDVTLFVVLGGRQDTLDSFKRTLNLSEQLDVGVHPVLLTPLPGTELYDDYREHLIPGLGWDSYIGVKAVFEHPKSDMTPVRRELEYHHLVNELFSFGRIIRRISAIPRAGFPSTHLLSFMMQMPMKIAFSKAYEQWKMAVQDPRRDPASMPSDLAAALRPEGGGGDKRTSASKRSDWRQRAETILPALYGLLLIFMTAVHFLHVRESGNIMSLASGVHMLDLVEDVMFWSLVMVGIFVLAIRESRVLAWYRTVMRIATDKINYGKLVMREFVYSSVFGAGMYWAYVCMVDVLR